jgi:hypothetical protein
VRQLFWSILIRERGGMTKDPWLRYGIFGGISFIFGWAVPEYFFKDEVTLIPFAGGLMFFVAALVMRQNFRKKKE